MRGTIDRSQPRTIAMIEQLESRVMLSADWVGTWQVSGMDVTMRSLPTKGAVAVTKPALTIAISQVSDDTYLAALTTKVGKQVRTEQHTLSSDANGLFFDDLSGTEVAPNGDTIHSKLYIRMMMVDADVRMFDMTSVGYTDSAGTQRIQWINVYAGVASRQKLQVVKFPYDGNYTFHGFTMDVNRDVAGVMSVDEYYNDPTGITFARIKGNQYSVNVDRNGDGVGDGATTFADRGGRLSQVATGPVAGGGYADFLQMYFRGPDGRMYFRSSGMVANTDPARSDGLGAIPAGQILNGWTTAGYSDVAPSNFAPVLAPSTGVALTSINQNQTDSQGTSVHAILASSGVTDWNPGDSVGIAITSLSTSKGTWEYSIDGGATWLPTGKVSTGHALLLNDSDLNRIRFIPKADYSGIQTKAMQFRAWDQTVGANGTFISASRAGKLTAFSTTRNYASLQVLPVAGPMVTSVFSDVPIAGGAVALLV